MRDAQLAAAKMQKIVKFIVCLLLAVLTLWLLSKAADDGMARDGYYLVATFIWAVFLFVMSGVWSYEPPGFWGGFLGRRNDDNDDVA